MPHRTMTNEDFWNLYEKQKRIKALMYTSEAAIAAFLFAWSIQLMQRQTWQVDPISTGLHQLAPFLPIWVHGAVLAAVCVLHFVFMVFGIPGWRRSCIFLEMGFLSFVEYDLILLYTSDHLFMHGLYALPVLVLFSLLNFLSLFKMWQPPASDETVVTEEREKCKTG